jgi:hypothetical protein
MEKSRSGHHCGTMKKLFCFPKFVENYYLETTPESRCVACEES